MPFGPIELLVVRFPRSEVSKGDMVPALKELVDNGLIRIIDILFVKKDRDGQVTMIEIDELDDDNYAAFDPIVEAVTGMLSKDDVYQITNAYLENDSSAGMMLFENSWATRFQNAVVAAQGQLVLNERIPRMVIEQLMADEQLTV